MKTKSMLCESVKEKGGMVIVPSAAAKYVNLETALKLTRQAAEESKK